MGLFGINDPLTPNGPDQKLDLAESAPSLFGVRKKSIVVPKSSGVIGPVGNLKYSTMPQSEVNIPPGLPLRYVGKDLASRLLNRFSLVTEKKAGKNVWEISPAIVPVTSADFLVKQLKRSYLTKDPLATGREKIWTVPVGKRWTPHVFNAGRNTGAAITVSYFTVWDPELPNTEMDIDLATAATAIVVYFDGPITFEANWSLGCNVAAYGAGETLYANLIYEEEDA